MERNFSEQDAIRVIEYNKNLLFQINSCFKTMELYQDSIKLKLADMKNKNNLEAFCEDELVQGKSLLKSNREALDLIKLIYCFRCAEYYIKKVKDIYEYKKGFISNSLDSLSICTDLIMWNNSRLDLRNNAVQAYYYFNSPEYLEFIKSSQDLIRKFDEFKGIDINNAINDYYKNCRDYKRIVSRLDNDILVMNGEIREIRRLFNLFDNIFIESDKIINSQRDYLDTAISCVQMYNQIYKTKSNNRFDFERLNESNVYLIKAIYAYINITEISEQIYELWSEKEQDIKSKAQLLEGITNGIQWLFFTPEEKIKAHDAYVYLSLLSESDFFRKIKQLFDEANTIDTMPNDTILHDYLENKSKYIMVSNKLCG